MLAENFRTGFLGGRGFLAQLLAKMPIKQTLTRGEKNRRSMNDLPMSSPPLLIRRHDQRSPMIELEAADEAAALEIARTAQIEAKEKSRLEHQVKTKLRMGC